MADPTHLPKPPKYHHHQHQLPIPSDPIKPPLPPKHHYQPHHHRKSRCCCSGCICYLWFLFSLLLLATLLALTVFLLRLSLHPQLPEFRIERLNITKFSISQRSDFSYLDSSVDVSLAASNKNNLIKFGLDSIRVRLYSVDDVRFGRAVVPGEFEMGEKDMAVVKVRAGVNKEMVDKAVGKLVVEKFKAEELIMDVEWDCRLDVAVGDWHFGKYPIMLVCYDIVLSRVGHGYAPHCGIDLYGWIPLS